MARDGALVGWANRRRARCSARQRAECLPEGRDPLRSRVSTEPRWLREPLSSSARSRWGSSSSCADPRRGHRARRAGRRIPRRLDGTVDGAHGSAVRHPPCPTRLRWASSQTVPAWLITAAWSRWPTTIRVSASGRRCCFTTRRSSLLTSPRSSRTWELSQSPAHHALSHRVAGVFYVATVEHARRRGLGDALTRMAARTGFEWRGRRRLGASEIGAGLYRRIGFEDLGSTLVELESPPG